MSNPMNDNELGSSSGAAMAAAPADAQGSGRLAKSYVGSIPAPGVVCDDRDCARDSSSPISTRRTPDQTGANDLKTESVPVTAPEQMGVLSKTLKGKVATAPDSKVAGSRDLRRLPAESGDEPDSASDSDPDPRSAYMQAQMRLYQSLLGYSEDGARAAWNFGIRLSWPGRWIRLAHPAFAPTFPGVYAICDGSRVLYIGESRNVARRLTNHLLSWSDGGGIWRNTKTRVNVRVRMNLNVRSGEHELLEIRLIQRLRPPFNIKHNPNPRPLPLPSPEARQPAPAEAPAQEAGRE